MKGGAHMQVINPFNRVPEADETMAMAIFNCHCVCSSGQQDEYKIAWIPLIDNCRCGCDNGTRNKDANADIARDAA